MNMRFKHATLARLNGNTVVILECWNASMRPDEVREKCRVRFASGSIKEPFVVNADRLKEF